jgi:uncharacterized membrane protein
MPYRAPLCALTVLGFAWAAHLAYFLPQLPEPIASHFAGNGQPDGWMSRAGFVGFEACLVGFMAGVFLGVGWLGRRYGATLIHVPNREYWFAPERSEASSARLLQALLWLLAGVVAFVIAVNQLVFEANRSRAGLSGADLLAVMACAVLAVIAWSLHLYRRFLRP